MSIMDIEQGLKKEASYHYGINFLCGDGVETQLPTESHAVVFTNNLTPWFSDHVPFAVKKRKNFFKETRRIIHPGGALIMVEHPLVNFYTLEDICPEIKADYKKVHEDLVDAGYRTIHIQPVETFKYQRDVDAFLKTGILSKNRQEEGEGSISPSLIVAY